MRKEIQSILTTLEIERKETRKETARNILIVVILATTFFLIPYFYPQFSVFYVVFVLIMIFGGIVVMDSIGTLYQPLKTESYAFKKIARAIQILEKSKKPITYEEAYRCLKHAHKILKNIELKDLEWYTKTNQTLKKFLKNLQLIVLPATRDSKIKTEHLEEIALAIHSLNPSQIETINETLEKETAYKKDLVIAVDIHPVTVKILREAHHGMSAFFGSHKILRFASIVSVLFLGCCAFYHVGVSYMDIQKEYVFTASVGAFLTLITLYSRKRGE